MYNECCNKKEKVGSIEHTSRVFSRGDLLECILKLLRESWDEMYLLFAYFIGLILFSFSTLASSDPYPMLVLTGPIGMGKKQLSHKLSHEFPNFFGVG